MGETFNVALNVASRGLFWRHVQKNIDTYYEEIVDLEADKKESIKVHIAVGRRLQLNWDEANLVLQEHDLAQCNILFAYFMREGEKLKNFLEPYALALTLFSKTNIHLRLEANAFDEFFKSFKGAMESFGDWDGEGDFKEVMLRQLLIFSMT
jgi:hypothetical protein